MGDETNIGQSRAGSANYLFNLEMGQEEEAVLTHVQGKNVFAYETLEMSRMFPVGKMYPALASTPLIPKQYFPKPQYLQSTLTLGESFDELIQDQVYTTRLNDIINELPLSEAEKGAIRFAYQNPDEEIDPSIKTKLESAKAQALKQLQAEGKVSADWQPPKADGKLFGAIYDASLDQAILEYSKANKALGKPDFTEAQILELRDAIYHPDKASDWAKKIVNSVPFKGALKSTLTSAGFTVPADWKPDATNYDIILNDQGDANFDKELFLHSQTEGLSTEEQQTIKNLYYNPSLVDQLPKTERNQQLINIYYTLLNNVDKGLPPSWSKVGDPAVHDAMIASNYRYVNEEGLNQAILDNKLSNEEALLVKKAMQMYSDGTDPIAEGQVPAKLAAIAQKILNQSKLAMISKYGLDLSWEPTGEVLPAPSDYDLSTITQTLNDYQTAIENYLPRFPEGPEKMLLINFLKSISDAMSGLKEDIYRMEALEATGHKELSQAQFETMKFKIDLRAEQVEKQRIAMAELAEDEAKAGKWSGIMDVVGPIAMSVAILATAVAAYSLGPVVGTILFAMLVPTMIDLIKKDNSASSWTFGIIGKGLVAIAKGMGCTDEKTLKGLEFTGKVIALMAVVAAASVGAAPPSAMLMIGSQFFASSQCVSDLSLACGANEQTAAITSMAVGGAVMLLSVAGAAKIAASNVAAVSAEQGAEAAAKTAEKATSTLTKNINIVNQATSVTAAGLNVGAAVVRRDADYARAALKELQAKFESGDVRIRDLIESLKLALKRLEAIMQNLSAWLSTVGESQAAIWEKNATPA